MAYHTEAIGYTHAMLITLNMIQRYMSGHTDHHWMMAVASD